MLYNLRKSMKSSLRLKYYKYNIFSKSHRNEIYDRQCAMIMERVLSADSSCIDVGAHTGEILQVILSIAPQGHHLAFEPLPGYADNLRLRFPRVQVFDCALS